MAAILQILGLGAISTGITLLSIPAGIIFAGVALVLLGLSIEKGR